MSLCNDLFDCGNAGTGRAVALHMAREENAVAADHGAEANPTGLKGRDQKVEQEVDSFPQVDLWVFQQRGGDVGVLNWRYTIRSALELEPSGCSKDTLVSYLCDRDRLCQPFSVLVKPKGEAMITDHSKLMNLMGAKVCERKNSDSCKENAYQFVNAVAFGVLHSKRSRSRARQRSYSGSSERSSHRRTPSGSRERERRKGRDREKGKEKGKGKEKETCGTKPGDCGNIKAGLEHLTPAEQAKARLQLVLEAAECVIRKCSCLWHWLSFGGLVHPELSFHSRQIAGHYGLILFLVELVLLALQFQSTEPPDLPYEPVTVGAGAADASAPEKDPAPASIPTAIKYQDDNSLAHPNLFIEKAEAEEKWFQRLIALRQERLMGSPVA
ncbi:Rsrc1 [Columba guinea]|nr:Rsrc1 [Columba guinea]